MNLNWVISTTISKPLVKIIIDMLTLFRNKFRPKFCSSETILQDLTNETKLAQCLRSFCIEALVVIIGDSGR